MFLWFATFLYLVAAIAPGEVVSFEMEVRGESVHVERTGDRWVATSPDDEAEGEAIYARVEGQVLYISNSADGEEEPVDMTTWFESLDNTADGVWTAVVREGGATMRIEQVEGGLTVTTSDEGEEELITTVTWTLGAADGAGSGEGPVVEGSGVGADGSGVGP